MFTHANVSHTTYYKCWLAMAVALALICSSSAEAANCSDAPVSGNYYSLINQGSGKAIDISGRSRVNGGNAIQWSYKTSSNQQFQVNNLGNGYWSLQASHSGRALDVEANSTGNGANILQWDYHGGNNQQWLFKRSSVGAFNIVSRLSGKSMSVGNDANGANVYQENDTASPYQRWYFNPVNGSCSGPQDSGAQDSGAPAACGIAAEHNSTTLVCPPGQVITGVTFASYGTPNGTCGSFSKSACDAASSASVVANTCKGNNNCTLNADNAIFGDPCYGTVKRLAAQVSCGTNSDTGSNNDNTPFGLARSVTGGAGGDRVRVRTVGELRQALCSTTSGGYCTDNMPRIIEVASTIDFTDSEGSAQGQACYATNICTASGKTEATLKYRASDTHCDGKTLFNITYKKAATRGLLVGSNKTLIGVGSAGRIKGKGLLLMGGVSNIIIRNLSFTDIAQGLVFGGDGITVADASRVWIDHNYFARIGRQLIVTGTGDKTGRVSDMTISWNEFDGRNEYSPYCNGKHYWNLLFYGLGNFTFANNWLHDFSGRGPKIDNQNTVQIVNNYFENGSGHALDASSSVQALIEGNDFQNVTTPITASNNHVYALRTGASGSGCQRALGRSCTPNQVSPATTRDTFKQDSSVLNAFDSIPRDAVVTPASASSVNAMVRNGAGVGKI